MEGINRTWFDWQKYLNIISKQWKGILIEYLLKTDPRDIERLKIRGPRIEPCGTPQVRKAVEQERSSLSLYAVCFQVLVFDFGSEVYLWHGRDVPPDRRSVGLQLTRQLWAGAYDYSNCGVNPLDPSQSDPGAQLYVPPTPRRTSQTSNVQDFRCV